MRSTAIILILLMPVIAHCQIVTETVYGKSLASNTLGEDPERTVLVYLPPMYETMPEQSYPAVYLLHAFGAGPGSWLGQDGYEGMNIGMVLDSLINNNVIEPMIVVMPDASSRFGGSWYTNSSAGGNWIDFISEDLIAYVDNNYRTIPDRNARGITGQSMGGYGALLIGMTRPDIFGSVLGMSAPNISNVNPFGSQAYEAALEMDETEPESWNIFGKLIWSKAVAFSPDPAAEPFHARLPVRKSDTGELVTSGEVMQKWEEYTLNRKVEKNPGSLRDLEIRLEVGDQDPLVSEVQSLSKLLDEMNITHELVLFQGDHVNGVRSQFETSVFRFFSEFFQVSAE